MSSVRRSSFIVSFAVMGSRVFGLIRDSVFAGLFGGTSIISGQSFCLLDCYLAAFQIPNLMRDLFAEGALSTAFTATFTKMWTKVGEMRAWELANRILSVVLVFMGVICLIGMLFSGPIVMATNFGFTSIAGKFALTTSLTQVMFFFILFVSVASVIMGMLNARSIFAIPASASTAFNIVSIISSIAIAYIIDPQSNWRHPHFGVRGIYGVAIGVMIGGLAQIGVQVPSLLRLGFRFHWSWGLKDEALLDVWRLMWPSIIAGAAIQVNVVINGMFASQIDGARTWLTLAFRLVQFPIGVFAVSIATATLPAVARHHAMNDLKAFGKTAEESLRLSLYLALPAAAGLAALAPGIISVIYQHGEFSAYSAQQTAWALRAYSVGLVGYSLIKILNPCFQALGLPKIPLRVNGFGIIVNVVMNFLLVKYLHWGHVGLAAATSCVATANCLQLAYSLAGRVSLGSWQTWSVLLLKLALASAACYGVAVYSAHWLWPAEHYMHTEVIAVLVSVALGAGAYFATTVVLGISESHLAVQMVKKRFSR